MTINSHIVSMKKKVSYLHLLGEKKKPIFSNFQDTENYIMQYGLLI